MIRRWLVVSFALLLAACSSLPRTGGYYEDDGPHRTPQVDISTVADAVPRSEPLSPQGNRPYSVFGKTYYPLKDPNGYRERGVASWYGKKFHGRRTSSGEPYDMYAMTAAHKTLPLPSYVRVRNLNNGRSVVVRVNDRGPFRDNRLIDLSYTAAAKLGIVGTGTGIVEITSITPDEPRPVTVATVAPPPRPAGNPAAPPRLYLQVGAFTQRDNAESLRSRLAQADFSQVHIQPGHYDETPLYRVRIGPLANVEASDRLAERIAGYGVTNAHVVVE